MEKKVASFGSNICVDEKAKEMNRLIIIYSYYW